MSTTNDDSPANDTLAQLRAEKIRCMQLECEISVLKLRLVHKDEDLNAAHAETAEVTRSWKELRGKYDGLKRKWESKFGSQRKGGPLNDGGEEDTRLAQDSHLSASIGEHSPVIKHPTDSASGNVIWPRTPVLPSAFFGAASPDVLMTGPPTNDPRKRAKLEHPTESPSSATPKLEREPIRGSSSMDASVSRSSTYPSPSSPPVLNTSLPGFGRRTTPNLPSRPDFPNTRDDRDGVSARQPPTPRRSSGPLDTASYNARPYRTYSQRES
ncbi:hypothetical protein C8J57DRAFT_1459345 [Mycena rebaudengoi]|nr:hypothetical protein C8J57DRAFT_1459345 [Mycena rebaudengoi]